MGLDETVGLMAVRFGICLVVFLFVQRCWIPNKTKKEWSLVAKI